MAEDNLAADAAPVTEAKTYDQSIDALSEILEDLEPAAKDPPKDKPDTKEAADADPDVDPADADAEDVEADPQDDEDGPQEPVKGGRFAPDTAKVTLEDGTVTTVAELKRGSLFQRDYTKKTTELSAEKEQVKAKETEVSQYAQQLNQSRDFLAWAFETYMPKQPTVFQGNPMEDIAGYMAHTAAKEQWEAMNNAYQQVQQQRQQEDQRKQGETTKQMQDRLQKEASQLRETYPVLKDPEKAKVFWAGTERDAQKYFGITQDEVRSIGDHRMVKVLRTAIQAERAREKAPGVKAEVEKRPPMRSGVRTAPEQAGRKDKQVLTERLRKTGDFDTGAALLERLL